MCQQLLKFLLLFFFFSSLSSVALGQDILSEKQIISALLNTEIELQNLKVSLESKSQEILKLQASISQLQSSLISTSRELERQKKLLETSQMEYQAMLDQLTKLLVLYEKLEIALKNITLQRNIILIVAGAVIITETIVIIIK